MVQYIQKLKWQGVGLTAHSHMPRQKTEALSTRDVNKDLTPKDQDKDKDLTPKDQDKDRTPKDQDKDLLDLTPKDKDKDLTPKDQDKDKDLKYVLKESLRTRTRIRTRARQIILIAHIDLSNVQW